MARRSDLLAASVALGWLSVAAALLLPVDRHASAVLVGLIVATAAHAAWLWWASAPGPRATRGLAAVALITHVLAVQHGALFSDDVVRYGVDAASSHAGLNPLAYAPGSAKMAGIADSLRPGVNHPGLRSIYPPLAQGWFAAVQWARPESTIGLRVGAMLAVLVAVWLLRRAPPARDEASGSIPSWLALLLHPLPLVCGSLDAHVDVLGLPIGVALCAALATERGRAAGLWIGAAIGVKLIPAVLLPALVKRRGGLQGAMVAVAVVGLAYLPWAALGGKALGSLGTYVAHWEFNAGLPAVVTGGLGWALEHLLGADGIRLAWAEPAAAAAGRVVVYNGIPSTEVWVTADQLARWIAKTLSLVALAVVSVAATRRQACANRSVSSLFMAVFLTSAVVHPWYLLWLLPSALWSGRHSALAWCSTVMLAFVGPARAVDTGVWTDPVWARVFEYVPVFALLFWRDRQRSPHL